MLKGQLVLPRIKRGIIRTAVMIISLFLLTGGTAAHANLITNGGFEDGLTGWTASEYGSSVYLISSPNSGQYATVLANENVSLSQTFATTPGEKYQLSYWLYNSGTPNFLQVMLNGTPLYGQTDLPWQPYTENALTFIADSALTTLAFNEGHGWTGNFYLDDVSVNPVPEPGTVFLLASGIIGLIGLRAYRRRTAA